MKQIDVHIDFSCPFSYLGGEKLLQTLENEALPLSTVRFRSFQLNPTKDNTQTDFLKNMSQRFGTDIPGTVTRYDRIIQAGKELGLLFDVTTIIDVNSINAHIGLQFATSYQKQGEYFRKIMAGHWEDGKDFSSIEFINDSLSELDLNIDEFRNNFKEFEKQVHEDIRLGTNRKIQGVPAFYRDKLLPLQSNSTFNDFQRVLNN